MNDPLIHSDFYKIFQNFPIQLIDIGAAGGVKDTWFRMKKYMRFIGFEPDPEGLCRIDQKEIRE